MNSTTSANPIPPSVAAVIFACALTAALFVLQRHFGYNLGDGGFLWYGAQRTLTGDVPLRDFMSYDPGRYWLAAAFMAAVHDNGIITLRALLAIVEAIGLSVAIITVARASSRPRFFELVGVALIAACWMYPEHKMFDIVLSIVIVAVFAFLIDKPSPKRFFYAGLYVGFSAVIGRNHGMYGLFACVLTMIYLTIRTSALKSGTFGSLATGAAWGALGIAAGYSPMLIALAVVPGLWPAFLRSVLLLLDSKATNLPLPIPWPWQVPFARLSVFEATRHILIGLGFVALPLFALVGVIKLLQQRRVETATDNVFAAAVITLIPYQHYAFSRADAGHLAHSIFPLLLGLMCWPGRVGSDKRWIVLLLLVASVVTMVPLMPRIQAMRQGDWRKVEVRGTPLIVDPGTAQSIELLQQLDRQYDGPDQTLLATPLWPGAYPLLNKVAPVWDIYGLFERDAKFENAEIERLRSRAVGLVVVLNYAVDGRDDLRFANTHPLLQRYIDQHFEMVPSTTRDPSIEVYTPANVARRSP